MNAPLSTRKPPSPQRCHHKPQRLREAWSHRALLSAALVGLVLGGGCSSDNGSTNNNNQDGGSNNQDGSTTPESFEVTTEVIEGLNSGAIVGDNAVMVLGGNGQPTVAYGFVPAGTSDRELHYAERLSDGTWSTQTITSGSGFDGSNVDFTGLGLAHVRGGPHVVYLGGDGDGVATTPFPTDLVLATRSGGTWSERIIADTSADAGGTCREGTQNTCNVGNVVGSHASIKANASGNGFAVAYRDTHFSYGLEDRRRADVEVYAEGGALMRSLVDPERSGGHLGDITYLQDGTLLLAYNLEVPPNEDETGVWVSYQNGANWEPVKVWPSQAASKIHLATAPGGDVYMVFNDVDNVDLIVLKSTDGGQSWSTEHTETAGKTGLHPNITLDQDGLPVVVYTYCGPQTEFNCPGQLSDISEVRMVRLKNNLWEKHTVDKGGVGSFNSVAVLSDGKLVFSYQREPTRANSGLDLIYAREL